MGDPVQTDHTPCIVADGSNACKELARGKKICTANFVPLGSRIFIQDFGICTIKNRLSSRYANRVDVAMGKDQKERAVKFVKQDLEFSVLDK